MKRTGLSLGILLMATLLFACAPKTEKQALPEALTKEEPALAKEGWEAEWEKARTLAKKEGKIVVYGSTGAAGARDVFIKSIREKYGLEVEMVIAGGTQLSQKILSERKAGLYLADVYVAGPTTMVTVFIPAGAFDPIEKSLILPEVYETKYWKGDKLPYFESGKYALRISSPAIPSMALNTNLIKVEEMRSFMDLLNPRWKGKMVMNDPSIAGSGQSFFYFVGMKIVNLDFMRQLAKQEPVILRDQRLMAEWLAREKYAIAIGPLPDPFLLYRNQGAPIILISYLKEGGYMGASAGHVALMNRAPHPKASAVFINWLLSREGQTLWSRIKQEPSMRKDVPATDIEPWRVPDPSKNYFSEDEETAWKKEESSPIAREIFGPLIK